MVTKIDEVMNAVLTKIFEIVSENIDRINKNYIEI